MRKDILLIISLLFVSDCIPCQLKKDKPDLTAAEC